MKKTVMSIITIKKIQKKGRWEEQELEKRPLLLPPQAETAALRQISRRFCPSSSKNPILHETSASPGASPFLPSRTPVCFLLFFFCLPSLCSLLKWIEHTHTHTKRGSSLSMGQQCMVETTLISHCPYHGIGSVELFLSLSLTSRAPRLAIASPVKTRQNKTDKQQEQIR